MWILVQTMNGKKSCRIEGLSIMTKIEDLRKLLVDKFNAPAAQQTLFFRGKQLEDGHCLFDYNIGLYEILQIQVKETCAKKVGKENTPIDLGQNPVTACMPANKSDNASWLEVPLEMRLSHLQSPSPLNRTASWVRSVTLLTNLNESSSSQSKAHSKLELSEEYLVEQNDLFKSEHELNLPVIAPKKAKKTKSKQDIDNSKEVAKQEKLKLREEKKQEEELTKALKAIEKELQKSKKPRLMVKMPRNEAAPQLDPTRRRNPVKMPRNEAAPQLDTTRQQNPVRLPRVEVTPQLNLKRQRNQLEIEQLEQNLKAAKQKEKELKLAATREKKEQRREAQQQRAMLQRQNASRRLEQQVQKQQQKLAELKQSVKQQKEAQKQQMLGGQNAKRLLEQQLQLKKQELAQIQLQKQELAQIQLQKQEMAKIGLQKQESNHIHQPSSSFKPSAPFEFEKPNLPKEAKEEAKYVYPKVNGPHEWHNWDPMQGLVPPRGENSSSNEPSSSQTPSVDYALVELQASEIFSVSLVKEVLKQTGKKFKSLNEICDAILEIEDRKQKHELSQSSQELKKVEKLRSEVTEENEILLCKICMEQQMNTLFEPCMHIATCKTCAQPLAKCPICRSVIMKKAEIYI